jgi:hypothetical protein
MPWAEKTICAECCFWQVSSVLPDDYGWCLKRLREIQQDRLTRLTPRTLESAMTTADHGCPDCQRIPPERQQDQSA